MCGYLVILMDMLDLMCGVLPLDLFGVMLLQIRMDLHLFEHVKLPVCYLLTHIAVEVTPGGPVMAKRVIALTILPPYRCMRGEQSPWAGGGKCRLTGTIGQSKLKFLSHGHGHGSFYALLNHQCVGINMHYRLLLMTMLLGMHFGVTANRQHCMSHIRLQLTGTTKLKAHWMKLKLALHGVAKLHFAMRSHQKPVKLLPTTFDLLDRCRHAQHEWLVHIDTWCNMSLTRPLLWFFVASRLFANFSRLQRAAKQAVKNDEKSVFFFGNPLAESYRSS